MIHTHARAYAHIDTSALSHNLTQVRKLAPHSHVIAMIKANAYGHGLLPVAQALGNADAFGVATLQEAITLREAGITQPIVVMCGFVNAQELALIVHYHLTAVLHQIDQINYLLRSTSSKNTLNVWLKIDTGMNRLGLTATELHKVYHNLKACSYVHILGFMTHLACSDQSADNPHTFNQIQQFNASILWPGQRSIACSAAILNWPQTHADWIRPGILLYGVSPLATQHAAEFNLKPVMTLKSRLIAIKQVPKGHSVGYGATWACEQDTRVGVVSIGYGDGYPRHAKSGTPVLVTGQRCPLIGRVSMDLITVNLNDLPHARIEDTVVLWGNGLPIEEVAAHANTIPYELLCRVTSRVR